MNLLSVAMCWLTGLAAVLITWSDERTSLQILHDVVWSIWRGIGDLVHAGRTLSPEQVLLFIILQTISVVGLLVSFYTKAGIKPW